MRSTILQSERRSVTLQPGCSHTSSLLLSDALGAHRKRCGILAAADDNRVSVLEILEKYPTAEMHIDVGKINKIVEKVKETIGNLGELLN